MDNVSAERYHADEFGDQLSLSSSIAKTLITKSPLHAWAEHPRLNPNYAPKDKAIFDLGRFVHAALLEENFELVVIDEDSWKTKAAREARDAAREAGMVPLLIKDFLRAEEMIAAVRPQLEAHSARPALLTDGKPEQTIVWEDSLTGSMPCRARLDWLRDDLTAIDDIKTTSASANPEGWSRTLFSIGADVQAAFYLRGLEAVTGATNVDFRFIVIETYPPFALSVVSLGPDVLTLARKKVDYALDLWARCLANDSWPAYPTDVCWAELPTWEESSWLAREARELVA